MEMSFGHQNLKSAKGWIKRTAYTVVDMMKGVVDGAYNAETGKRKGTGIRLRMDLERRKIRRHKSADGGKNGNDAKSYRWMVHGYDSGIGHGGVGRRAGSNRSL